MVGIFGGVKIAGSDGRRFINITEHLPALAPTVKLRACWSTLFVCDRQQHQTICLVLGANHLGQSGISLTPADEHSSPSTKFRRLYLKETVLDIASGSEHLLALVQDQNGAQSVLGWGWNEHGNLGLGYTENLYTPTLVWRLPQRGLTARIFAGNGTSFITQDEI